MRLIPVPDSARAAHPAAVRRVFGPPDGDPTGDIRPAELLVDRTIDGALVLRGYFALDPGDLAALTRDGEVYVEYSVFADHLHPFALDVWRPDACEGCNRPALARVVQLAPDGARTVATALCEQHRDEMVGLLIPRYQDGSPAYVVEAVNIGGGGG